MNNFNHTQSPETVRSVPAEREFTPERSVLDLLRADSRERMDLPAAVCRLGDVTAFPLLAARSWQPVLDIMVALAGETPKSSDGCRMANLAAELRVSGIQLEDRGIELVTAAIAEVAYAPTISAGRCVTAVLGRASREASLAGWDMSVDDYYEVRDHLLGVSATSVHSSMGIAA